MWGQRGVGRARSPHAFASLPPARPGEQQPWGGLWHGFSPPCFQPLLIAPARGCLCRDAAPPRPSRHRGRGRRGRLGGGRAPSGAARSPARPGRHVQGHSRAQLPAQAQPQIPAEPGPRHSPCPSTTLTSGRARHNPRPRHSPGPGTTPGHSPRTRHSSDPGHSPCPRYSSGPYPRPSPSPGTAPEGCGGRTAAGPASARCGGQAPPPGRGAKVRTASAVCLFLVCFSLNPIPETKGESGRNYGSVWPRIQSGAPVVTRRLPRAAQP